MAKKWPILSYESGKSTYETLQCWTQIVGKIKLATLPWVNHSWNVTLHSTLTGLTTLSMPCQDIAFQIDFDFLAHQLKISTSTGELGQFNLHGHSVASFYERLFALLNDFHIEVAISTLPSEIANPIPFERDTTHATYDDHQVACFHQALLAVQDVFMVFRSGFMGKSSPIHFFWGGFDLALGFYSGRKAPKHPGKVPGLPNWVLQDSYNHEVVDFGFWTGNEAFPEAAFYSYLYPEPQGYRNGEVAPSDAYYHQSLVEFILPYAALQKTKDPAGKVLEFLRSTYAISSRLANWESDLYGNNGNFTNNRLTGSHPSEEVSFSDCRE